MQCEGFLTLTQERAHVHTLSHTHAHTHSGLLTVTFDVKAEASDIYAGGFIKVGPGRSSRGKDHREGIQLKHDRAQGS